MTQIQAGLRRRALRIFLWSVWISLGVVPARADETAPTVERIGSWIREEWNRAQEYPPISGFMVEYSREFVVPLPTREEVENLRRLVAGIPDHPNRPVLLEYERLLKDGGKQETYRIWSEGPGRFRRSADFNYNLSTHPFFDLVIVAHDDRSWSLNKNELGVYSPASGFPANRQYESYEDGFTYELNLLFFGGLGAVSSPDIDPQSISNDGDSVRLVIGSADGAAAAFTVRWDAEINRGFVQELRFIRAGGDFAGRRMEFADWVFDPELQSWRASKVVEFNADESPRTILRFIHARMITPEEFDQVTAVPLPLGADPVRGTSSYSAFSDFRSGQSARQVDINRENLQSIDAAQAQVAQTASGGSSRVVWYISGVALLLLCTVLIGWQIRTKG